MFLIAYDAERSLGETFLKRKVLISSSRWLEGRKDFPFHSLLLHHGRTTVCCERNASGAFSTARDRREVSSLTRTRRFFHSLSLASLPLPRLLNKRDPDLVLRSRYLRQRQRDSQAVQALQNSVAAETPKDSQAVAGIVKTLYELLYGKGVGPQDRQDFLSRYGCTGWTDAILDLLLELAADRGIVEIGAGNGQWARALVDRYIESTSTNDSNFRPRNKQFDFVLAYDDMSQLPLDPKVFHEKTQPYREYFHKVRHCDSSLSILQQWTCRGRVLLLVYPPPGGMAVNAAHIYVESSPELNDTIVYVGEGRGGSNADDIFFDFMEEGDWILEQSAPVHSFGDKGYEKLFVFRRAPFASE